MRSLICLLPLPLLWFTLGLRPNFLWPMPLLLKRLRTQIDEEVEAPNVIPSQRNHSRSLPLKKEKEKNKVRMDQCSATALVPKSKGSLWYRPGGLWDADWKGAGVRLLQRATQLSSIATGFPGKTTARTVKIDYQANAGRGKNQLVHQTN
ncbi:hypothetical protein B0H16DRAFT_1452489 [Mycena metata]|uniref:Uncharacterized protein n=1 Tax=Mycena metata TaxID=1033252 RepID=A0AAD7NP81_9AGAR|nr:hypothetical protein B0H16DRAFT_1452489 [Mycena metata]